MTHINLRWSPPGPVAARFMESTAPVKMIMGPIGSGKTGTCLMHLVLNGIRLQRPSPVDGVRYFKFAVIRDTYRNLRKTTIPSWHQWIPKTAGEWSGDEPSTHVVPIELPGGILVDLTVEFIALGENKVEDVMRGWEGTAVYLNEADLLSRDVLTYVMGRIGRYPSKRHGKATWAGVVLDMNAPDTENWTYHDFVENLPDGYEFYRQPSGYSPQAENVENLPVGYYENASRGQPEWYIRRMIKAEFGYSRDGKPVYPEYNDALHVAGSELVPDRGLPLIIGLDAGGNPAATIEQRRPNGQWRCLDELVAGEDGFCGPTRFSEYLNQLLRDRYAGLPAFGHADPSAIYGADKEAGESNWIQIVSGATGIPIRPAPTNELSVRLDAVRVPLTRMIDGREPAFLLSPRCKLLRKGFNSDYRYRRILVTGSRRYNEKPEKNQASHPQDGLQYGQMGGGEYAEVMGRQEARYDTVNQVSAITDDNPDGGFRDPRRRRRRQTHAELD